MPVARDAGHVTKNFPRAIKVPINRTREQLPARVQREWCEWGATGSVHPDGFVPLRDCVVCPSLSFGLSKTAAIAGEPCVLFGTGGLRSTGCPAAHGAAIRMPNSATTTLERSHAHVPDGRAQATPHEGLGTCAGRDSDGARAHVRGAKQATARRVPEQVV